MENTLLLNEILAKIEFKISPNKNIRKEYLYRIKKNFYKLINSEKKLKLQINTSILLMPMV